jgi:type 1 fimbriae regulatory protein FimE
MPTSRKRTGARKSRDHLLPKEVDRLLEAALETGRHGHRNYTLILLCYRHALRLNELRELRWNMVDFKRRHLRVKRVNNGINSVHPLDGTELKALRKLKRDYPGSRYLFVTDREDLLSQRTVSRIVAAAGRSAGLRFHVSPRMVRHACGYALANAGHNVVALQHYLGYRNIRHMSRYLRLPERPFKDFAKDLKVA